ncbi:peptidoglycan-binding domain-containing protein [Actinoplanes sp. NPDC051470]|uniref:peptidoglycan-binding domain-containing protein n=1 Tax=Actinoplanes sp. NPDC051470 TaxID=3157224 RepID=UPI00342A82EF
MWVRKIMLAVAAGLALIPAGAGAAQAAGTPSLTTCTDQLLIMGSSGPCVSSMQESLEALGMDVGADGQYGARTRLAVYYFQVAAGLDADGEAGPITITALDRIANSPAGLTIGLPRMPDGDAEFSPAGNGVLTKGLGGIGTQSYYFSRGASRMLNDALNDPENGAGSAVTEAVACAAITAAWGPAFPLAEAGCTAIGIGTVYNVERAAQDAVDADGCFEIKVRRFSASFSAAEYTHNEGHNCIP